MGHKVNPIGPSARHQPDLGFALVRRAPGLRQACCTKIEDARGDDGALEGGGRFARHHRASARKCRVTIYTARPGVIIGKKGADIEKLRQDLAQDDRSRCSSEHRRGQEARDRRKADRRKHRPATRAPRCIPSRDEARCAIGAAARRARHQDQLRVAGLAALRSRAPSGIARAACRCIRCAPISITALRPRTRPMALAASKCGCSRARSWSTTRWRSIRSLAEMQEAPAGVRARRANGPSAIVRTGQTGRGAAVAARRGRRGAAAADQRRHVKAAKARRGLEMLQPARIQIPQGP